jgi:hypothetical protein
MAVCLTEATSSLTSKMFRFTSLVVGNINNACVCVFVYIYIYTHTHICLG